MSDKPTARGKMQYDEAVKMYRQAHEEYYANDLRNACSHLIQVLDAFRAAEDYNMLARSYIMLGVIYASTGSTAQAIEYYLKGLEYARTYGLLYLEILCLNNLGSYYQEIGRHERALEFFEECYDKIDHPDLDDNPDKTDLKIVLLENMIISHMKLNHLYRVERYLRVVKELQDAKGARKFDILLLENMFLWRSGKGDEVRKNLPVLEKELLAVTEPADFIFRVSEYVALLKEMQELDCWKRILDYSYKQADQYQSNSVRVTVLELCLDYAKTAGMKAEYGRLCELYTEASLAMKEEKDLERQQIADVQMELYEKEKEQASTQREKRKMQELAETDALTGLGSRYSLRKYGNDLLEKAKEERSHLVVGLLDVDCFKQYNDTYGHIAGDECLVKVAEVLKNALGKVIDKGACGKAFRYGGDELLLLLAGTTEQDLYGLAEEIAAEVEKLKLANENSTVKEIVTLSQGYFCQVPRDDESLEDVLKKADVQLYKVKDNNKDDFLITVGA